MFFAPKEQNQGGGLGATGKFLSIVCISFFFSGSTTSSQNSQFLDVYHSSKSLLLHRPFLEFPLLWSNGHQEPVHIYRKFFFR